VKVNEPGWGARRRGGRNETVDVVLGVKRLLIAMDVVMAAFAHAADFIDPVDQMNPMEVIFPVDRVIKVCARSVASSPGC
jgi:hypothetical protein